MKYEKYIGMLKSKILSEEDIKEICKEFNLTEPNFNDSHDWIFKMMSIEMLRNRDSQRFKQYLTKFPNSDGLDLKKLKKQINLSFEGRTPEQQRNDMFKTMNEANKNRESCGTIMLAEMEELRNNESYNKEIFEYLHKILVTLDYIQLNLDKQSTEFTQIRKEFDDYFKNKERK